MSFMFVYVTLYMAYVIYSYKSVVHHRLYTKIDKTCNVIVAFSSVAFKL